MRPDKKKKVHHDSKKAKSRALASNNGVSDSKNSRSLQDAAQPSRAAKESDTPAKTNNIPSSLIGHGNVTEINPEDDTVNHVDNKDYSKRIIESNWAKYDVPLSDSDQSESDTLMTGLDFNYVIQNALKSESMFRLKAEKEWEEKQTMFTDEIFSLNMTNLEKAVSCVPLPVQLDIPKLQFEENLFCPDGYKNLVEKARKNFENWSDELKIEPKDDIETVNERLVSMLISKNEPLEEIPEKSSHLYDNSYNSKFKKEQKDKVNIKNPSVKSIPGVHSTDGNSMPKQPQVDSDLEQLLMVDSIQNNAPPAQTSSNPGDVPMVVKCDLEQKRGYIKSNTVNPKLLKKPVDDKTDSDTNYKNQTENLEDWLDDFLSD